VLVLPVLSVWLACAHAEVSPVAFQRAEKVCSPDNRTERENWADCMALQGYPHGGAPPDGQQTEDRAEVQCSVFRRGAINWLDCMAGQGFPRPDASAVNDQDRTKAETFSDLAEERDRARTDKRKRAETECADHDRATFLWNDCMAARGFPKDDAQPGPAKTDEEPSQQANDGEDPAGSSASSGAPPERSSVGSSSGSSSGGTVHVRGYVKKDGTYVAPHTRHSPRR
jgi:hypothetical protein